MKILAVEFSTDQRSVAILADGAVRAEVAETATRSTHAFALIEKALRDAKIEREEIECLAIGLGPGSYHGIRAAIALAQGWQLARPIKLIGISSAECIAAEAQAKGLFGIVNLVIDAQRNELYTAAYHVGSDSVQEILPLRLAPVESTKRTQQFSPGELTVGPEATRWFASAQNIFPTAATLGRLAANRTDFVPGEKLEPIYLRETNFVKAPPPRIPPDA